MLGTGNVGGALLRLWQQKGHSILLVAHSEPKGKTLRERYPGVEVGGLREAEACEVVALCVPWQAVEEILAGAGDLKGRVVVDCTNPLSADIRELAFGGTASAAERIQAWKPRAHVVKAFNSLGAALLESAEDGAIDGFYAGNDAGAKRMAATLIADASLNPVDVGALHNARYLEAMAMLWIDLAYHQQKGPAFAFKMQHIPGGGQ